MRPVLGLGTIAMLAPENKNCLCFLVCVCRFFYISVFLSHNLPDLLTLSDRLSVLEVLRDVGSSVAWRSRP